jgi:SAM-dependent MidA family methyltransferase
MPLNNAALATSNLELASLIATEIQNSAQQRITFARFMELALYQPQLGYYATRADQIGPTGDFFTSPHLAADFAELLAEQFVEMWHILGCPTPMTLVEMGAGQGLVAADILAYLQIQHPDCFASLAYWIVEKVPELVALQQKHLQAWQHKLTWCSLDQIPANSVTGCFFSNELVDAFPVHRLMVGEPQLQEVYVQLAAPVSSTSGITFSETLGPLSTAALSAYLKAAGLDLQPSTYPTGYRTEVNLLAQEWLAQVAQALNQGYVLTIDYGYEAHQYYSPARVQGTLQCYRQHSSHADPYQQVGLQDITTHVDFSHLQQQGHHLGLTTTGLTSQALFLMGLGLGERLAANNLGGSGDFMAVIKRRDALHQLMNPLGLGGFKILVQHKNLTPDMQKNTLQGLQGETGNVGLLS